MTEKNTEIMRDVFRFYSEFEQLPPNDFGNALDWWSECGKKIAEYCKKWKNDPLMVRLLQGCYYALTDRWNAEVLTTPMERDAMTAQIADRVFRERNAEKERQNYLKKNGQQEMMQL